MIECGCILDYGQKDDYNKRNHIKLNMAKPEKSGDAKLKGLSRCMTASCTYDNEALLLGINERSWRVMLFFIVNVGKKEGWESV